MAASDIKPGSKVTLTVVKTPSNAGARKTLERLLCKDEARKLDDRRLAKIRKTHYSPRRRGGRLYSGRVPKQHLAHGHVGESGTITATNDVLRDLPSVERFLEIKEA